MGLEAGILKKEDKKRKEISERQKLQIKKGIITIKELRNKEKKEDKVEKENLESNMNEILGLVEKGIVSKENAQKVIDGTNLDEKLIKEIFEKIEQIEEIKDIDKYLPQELRITKEDYIKALTDDIFRVQIIIKLDSALTLLANKIIPDAIMGLNLFSGFLTLLDKNLIVIQENTIDLKDSLKKMDEERLGNKEGNRGLQQKMIDFLKELIK